jgi:hypothetical protein
MIKKISLLVAVGTVCLATPALAADEKKPDKPAAEKKADQSDPSKDEKGDKDVEKNKKETDSILKRLDEDAKKKLWEVVTKGSDEELKATKLQPEAIEALKEARPNLKGWGDILTTESLGRDVLRDLVAYGASPKFAKEIADEKKAKEKAEKDRERDIKKARKAREAERKADS